jgi:[ribosomal protein S5]-alanine N-acetyltransferase
MPIQSGSADGAVPSGAVIVRPARSDDAEPLATLYRANRHHLAPFEPHRDEDFFTLRGQEERLAALLGQQDEGVAHPYVIEVQGELVGRVTVTNVSRGPFCSGSLGYWVAAASSGRGVATCAVRQVIDDCFGRHGLHRLEAATLVDNLPSRSVLRKTGFSLIGLAPGYPHIAGQWRDHLLFQRIAGDPASGPPSVPWQAGEALASRTGTE